MTSTSFALPNTFRVLAPKRSEFINKIIPRLQILYNQSSDNSNDGQKNDSKCIEWLYISIT